MQEHERTITDLLNTITSITAHAAQVVTQRDALRDEVADLNKQLAERRDRIIALTTELTYAREDLAKAAARADALQAQIAPVVQDRDALKTQVADLMKERDALHEARHNAVVIAALHRDIKQLNERASALEAARMTLIEALKQLNERASALDNRLEAARMTLIEALGLAKSSAANRTLDDLAGAAANAIAVQRDSQAIMCNASNRLHRALGQPHGKLTLEAISTLAADKIRGSEGTEGAELRREHGRLQSEAKNLRQSFDELRDRTIKERDAVAAHATTIAGAVKGAFGWNVYSLEQGASAIARHLPDLRRERDSYKKLLFDLREAVSTVLGIPDTSNRDQDTLVQAITEVKAAAKLDLAKATRLDRELMRVREELAAKTAAEIHSEERKDIYAALGIADDPDRDHVVLPNMIAGIVRDRDLAIEQRDRAEKNSPVSVAENTRIIARALGVPVNISLENLATGIEHHIHNVKLPLLRQIEAGQKERTDAFQRLAQALGSSNPTHTLADVVTRAVTEIAGRFDDRRIIDAQSNLIGRIKKVITDALSPLGIAPLNHPMAFVEAIVSSHLTLRGELLNCRADRADFESLKQSRDASLRVIERAKHTLEKVLYLSGLNTIEELASSAATEITRLRTDLDDSAKARHESNDELYRVRKLLLERLALVSPSTRFTANPTIELVGFLHELSLRAVERAAPSTMTFKTAYGAEVQATFKSDGTIDVVTNTPFVAVDASKPE